MKLTVVGCSGSFPGPASPTSCYLLEHEGHRILLDMGNGSLGALQQHADIYAIDAVVVSHLHVDHFIDLCSYYVARRFHPDGPRGSVPVYGPSDTARRLVSAYGLGSDSEVAGELDVRPLLPEFTIGPFSIRTAPMVHPIEAHAIRVDVDGRSITYSGDTGPTPELVRLAEGTNVALFEASFVEGPANPRDLHLTSAEAARAAADAGAERLVLTHFVPWNRMATTVEQALPHFPGLHLARQGLALGV